jgi:hypothetical protein
MELFMKTQEMQEALIVNYIEIYDGDDDQATIEEYNQYIMSLDTNKLIAEYNNQFDY